MTTELKTFRGSQFIGKFVLADIEFIPHLEKINQFAVINRLKILVTSSTRPFGVAVKKIVPAARRSNHLVGHAIDINVQIEGILYNGTALGNFNSLPLAIKAFINAIRNEPVLRWGGDFKSSEPVHIDDGLNINNPHNWSKKFSIIQSELSGLIPSEITTLNYPKLFFLTTTLIQKNEIKITRTKYINSQL